MYTRKREKEKQERRGKRQEEILVSAEKLFREKGIKTTKMTDIARDCELGKSSLYFYFKSKDEIVWHLLKKYSLEEYEAGHGYLRSIEGTAYES